MNIIYKRGYYKGGLLIEGGEYIYSKARLGYFLFYPLWRPLRKLFNLIRWEPPTNRWTWWLWFRFNKDMFYQYIQRQKPWI